MNPKHGVLKSVRLMILKEEDIRLNHLLSFLFRPFERIIVLQKDSSGHVGFVFKNGKITQIAKDTSAARFVYLCCYLQWLFKKC